LDRIIFDYDNITLAEFSVTLEQEKAEPSLIMGSTGSFCLANPVQGSQINENVDQGVQIGNGLSNANFGPLNT